MGFLAKMFILWIYVEKKISANISLSDLNCQILIAATKIPYLTGSMSNRFCLVRQKIFYHSLIFKVSNINKNIWNISSGYKRQQSLKVKVNWVH